MKGTYSIKLNLYLLLMIIPLSALGYYFAVHDKTRFFLYEWLLAAIVIVSLFLSIKSIISSTNGSRWASMSIFAFLVQFSVLALFLGPLTHYAMFYVYYVATAFSLTVFIMAIRKKTALRLIPAIFILLSCSFTIYVLFLHALWAHNLS
ncbi:hypothetical protein [Peribacillus sp. SCS-155]|uniref:hypothetical protein n=1 Tax=Peribacillus sedimenti TaxID=3115297 RepID=UPI003906400A